MKHDIQHALYPLDAGCTCSMADITNCVVCNRDLPRLRQHVDTCGGSCFKRLLAKQREGTT